MSHIIDSETGWCTICNRYELPSYFEEARRAQTALELSSYRQNIAPTRLEKSHSSSSVFRAKPFLTDSAEEPTQSRRSILKSSLSHTSSFVHNPNLERIVEEEFDTDYNNVFLDFEKRVSFISHTSSYRTDLFNNNKKSDTKSNHTNSTKTTDDKSNLKFKYPSRRLRRTPKNPTHEKMFINTAPKIVRKKDAVAPVTILPVARPPTVITQVPQLQVITKSHKDGRVPIFYKPRNPGLFYGLAPNVLTTDVEPQLVTKVYTKTKTKPYEDKSSIMYEEEIDRTPSFGYHLFYDYQTDVSAMQCCTCCMGCWKWTKWCDCCAKIISCPVYCWCMCILPLLLLLCGGVVAAALYAAGIIK